MISSVKLLAAGLAAAELRRMGETVVSVRVDGQDVPHFDTAKARARALLDGELKSKGGIERERRDAKAAAAKLQHGSETPRQQQLAAKFFASELGRKARAVMAIRPEIMRDRVLVELTLSEGRQFVVPMSAVRIRESLRWLTFSSHAELLAAVPVPIGPLIIGSAVLYASAHAALARRRGDATLAKSLAAVASKHAVLFGPSFLFPVDSVILGMAAALDLDARRALRRGKGLVTFELGGNKAP